MDFKSVVLTVVVGMAAAGFMTASVLLIPGPTVEWGLGFGVGVSGALLASIAGLAARDCGERGS